MGKVIITKIIVPDLDFLNISSLIFLLVKCWYRINIFSLTVYVLCIKIVKKIINKLCNR